MENRSHLEPLDNRLKRFHVGGPEEIIMTLLLSIDNHFNNEIKLTTKLDNAQTSLLFLGIHAAALTISEGFFGDGHLEGYRNFLNTFIDGDSADTKFSQIAEKIHGWRNILAHQWLGISGYEIGYDYTSKFGWEDRNGVIFINPIIYCQCYLNAFAADGKIWNYDKIFSNKELEEIKQRLLKKFLSK